jgi:hypothetical protein
MDAVASGTKGSGRKMFFECFCSVNGCNGKMVSRTCYYNHQKWSQSELISRKPTSQHTTAERGVGLAAGKQSSGRKEQPAS